MARANQQSTFANEIDAMVWLFGLTLFISAFLLFLVQPMVGKMVLPLLGGSPAVWNTCMLFFQGTLLGACAYSHWAPVYVGGRRHALGHLAILALPLCVLPIGVAGWIPGQGHSPVVWLLMLLAVCVGLPFFAIATSAPLVQRWFAQSGHGAAGDPYFLYAASNLGSMAALLLYPVLIEPNLRLGVQSRAWTAGYLGLLLLSALCVQRTWRSLSVPASSESKTPAASAGHDDGRPGMGRRLDWAAWAIVPSSMMLGVTTYLSTDVAPIPLLWVLPLAVYLFTFVLAFSRLPLVWHRLMIVLLPAVIVVLVLARLSGDVNDRSAIEVLHVRFHNPFWGLGIAGSMGLQLLALFVVALVCHGELARDRPPAQWLTEFYLWISIGGVLGGAFNALVAPALFDRLLEYPLIAVIACLLAPHLGGRADRGLIRSMLATCWVVFGLWSAYQLFQLSNGPDPQSILHRERNFFGVLSVSDNDGFVRLLHGTTTHGIQHRGAGQEGEPLTYYARSGPIGQFFAAFSGTKAKESVALIGLGTGTLASYAQPGQHWTFFEIDPAVERIAREPRYFTYLADAEARGADIQVNLGDGRLQMGTAPGNYGLIVVDAFSSDAIPLHLLTREALKLYVDRLAPGGVLAFHLSNKYVELEPVVANLATDAGLYAVIQRDTTLTYAEFTGRKFGSVWALVARQPQDLGRIAEDKRWHPASSVGAGSVWTDDYSNLFGALKWGLW
jgi:spermidine synthase